MYHQCQFHKLVFVLFFVFKPEWLLSGYPYAYSLS